MNTPDAAREHIRIVAVIQARMGSTRLPGKVLKPIAGQPLLWHIVHRLRACRLLEEIAVATTGNPADDAIVDWCDRNGVTVVRRSPGVPSLNISRPLHAMPRAPRLRFNWQKMGKL